MWWTSWKLFHRNYSDEVFFNFRSISEHITPKSDSLNYFGYYTIVLTQLHKDQATIVTNILRDCWKSDIFDTNVLTLEPTGDDLALYTYFPFTPSSCGEIKPMIWNHFRKDRFVNANREMFPLKMKNFHQCPISILVCPLQPYIFVTKIYSNDTYEFEGNEYNLLHTLSERLNFKPEFSVHWDPNLGNIDSNGTATLAFGMVCILYKFTYPFRWADKKCDYLIRPIEEKRILRLELWSL